MERSTFDADEMVLLVAVVGALAAHTVRRNDGLNDEELAARADRSAPGSDEKGGAAATHPSRRPTVRFDDQSVPAPLGDSSKHDDGGSLISRRTGDGSRSKTSLGSKSLGSAEQIDLQAGASINGSAGSVHSPMVMSMLVDNAENGRSKSGGSKAGEGDDDGTSPGSRGGGSTLSGSLTNTRRSLLSDHSLIERQLDEILLDDEETVAGADPNSDSAVLALMVEPVNPVNDILNYPQTLEWKGIMTVLFLVYQVTNAGSYTPLSDWTGRDTLDEDAIGAGLGSLGTVNHYYNFVRLSVTSYLFATGYGHSMHFLTQNDFSLSRLTRVVFRINLGVLFLCLTLGNRYILYNTCPLHTYFFLMVYATLKVRRDLNHTKFGLRLKVLALAAAIFLVWDIDLGLFRILHSPFFTGGPGGLPGAPHGPMWEWYYRSHLHHWAAFVGMVYAVNYPITSLLQRKLEALGDLSHVLSKAAVGAALLATVLLWTAGPMHMTKIAFNGANPYFGFIPVISYLYFRNIAPALRENSVGLFKVIGFYSLELYLLHHHVFLASNGSALTVFLPGYPKCNLIVITSLLFFLARTLRNLTSILTGMLLPPDDDGRCVRSVILLGGTVACFYGMALALDSMKMVSLGTVATITVITGVLIYQTVMDMTWMEYVQSQKEKPQSQRGGTAMSSRKSGTDESPAAKISPPLIGTAIVFSLGILWHAVALSGASSSPHSPLSPSCDAVVNYGRWVPVDPCSAFHRGLHTREYGMGSTHAGCDVRPKAEGADDAFDDRGLFVGGDALQWGWYATPPGARCSFRHRPADELQRKLRHRAVVFVGDTMMRNLFHAACRSLGDLESGGYDATVAMHSDITKSFGGEGGTVVEYKWAPLAVDAESKLKEYRAMAAVSSERGGRAGGMAAGGGGSSLLSRRVPDLIVVGGGAWDRLHVWATDEDQESHKEAVTKLAAELAKLGERGVPTVWFTPTTVNTRALNTEEKRIQMSEEGMEDMRTIYAELGVEDAASFVLDGPSFTRDRSAESYDGVHYSGDIYDAGVQIWANALDWLLPDAHAPRGEPFQPPRPGVMANPFLGTMMLCFTLVGLFFFDGYFGFSYLASVFARGGAAGSGRHFGIFSVMPNELYEEAFAPANQRLKPFTTAGEKREKGDDNPEMDAIPEYEVLSLLGNGGSGRRTARSRKKL